VGMMVAKRSTTRALAAEWPLGLGPASSVPAHFPKLERNAEAMKLTDLAMKIGIDLAPKSDRAPRTETPQEKAYAVFRATLDNYESAQIAKADDFVDAPPEKLTAFLDAHAADISALRSELLRGERIEWQQDLDRLFEAPIPNLVGNMTTAKLFATMAMIKARNNDPSAWDDLHAAWMLHEPLRRRPDLISQLIGIAGARMVNGAARKLPAPEPAWRSEMTKFNFRRGLMMAQQAEAYVVVRVLERAPMGIETTDRPAWWGPAMSVMRPYMAISSADLVNHHRQAAVEIAAMTKCGFDAEAFDRRILESVPRWDMMGRIVIPDLGAMYYRQTHLEPEMEATTNLLALKAARAASPAHEWPQSLANTSSRCSDVTWVYEKHPDGTASLRLSKALPPVKNPQPLEFSLAK